MPVLAVSLSALTFLSVSVGVAVVVLLLAHQNIVFAVKYSDIVMLEMAPLVAVGSIHYPHRGLCRHHC